MSLPKTNIAPKNGGFQARNLLSQGSMFRGERLVSGRVVTLFNTDFQIGRTSDAFSQAVMALLTACRSRSPVLWSKVAFFWGMGGVSHL